MNIEDARLVAGIISTADNHCTVCMKDLMEKMQKAFPEFKWSLSRDDLDGQWVVVVVE